LTEIKVAAGGKSHAGGMVGVSTEKTTIVVVEDDPAVLHSLQFTLETDGYRVCAFGHAAAALASPSLEQADCLVIDYGLPDLHGAALLVQLRSLGIKCPAIFIASNPTPACRRDIAAAGAPLIEKPLMGNVLGDQIRSLL
jgi:FixJ family two-component response regulator